MSQEADNSSRKKNFIIMALVPSLIAGAFALAPKIYDVLTQPKADLTFRVENGPVIQADSKSLRIASLVVENTGTKGLTDIAAAVNFPQAKIVQVQIANAEILRAESSVQGSRVHVKLPALLPKDVVTIAFLVESSSGTLSPIVFTRSAEIVGRLDSIGKRKENSFDGSVAGAILSGSSVLVMIFLYAHLVRKRGGQVLSVFSVPSDKQEIICFIAAQAGLPDVVKVVAGGKASFSYFGVSDYFLAAAISNGESLARCVLASKALLIVDEVAKDSIEKIVENIRALEGEDFLQGEIDLIRERATSIERPLELRRAIRSFMSAPEQFVSDHAYGVS